MTVGPGPSEDLMFWWSRVKMRFQVKGTPNHQGSALSLYLDKKHAAPCVSDKANCVEMKWHIKICHHSTNPWQDNKNSGKRTGKKTGISNKKASWQYKLTITGDKKILLIFFQSEPGAATSLKLFFFPALVNAEKSSFGSPHACAANSCPAGHHGQLSYDLFDDCVSALLWFLSNDQLSRVTTPGTRESVSAASAKGLRPIGTAGVSLICYRAILPPCQKRCQSKDKVCVRAPLCVPASTSVCVFTVRPPPHR